MLNTHLGGDFSLDMQSVQRLKHTAKERPDQGLEASAKQFEAMFLQKMLKVMREAMPKSDLMHSNQTELTQSLMDRQWAQTMSERGIGLADMLTRQLQRSELPAATADQPLRSGATGSLQRSDATGLEIEDQPRQIAGFDQAKPRALGPSTTPAPATGTPQSDTSRPLVSNDHPHALFAGDGVYKGAPLVELDPQGSMDISHVDSAVVRDFVGRMGTAAHTASANTGVPQRLILAQAALETGWGRHEVMRDDGRPSYNVFNIKAVGWQGDSADANTTEYVDGQARAERAAFRAYDSYDQAFGDYARLLSESPRYAGLANVGDPAAAARVLQDSGYATDPRYADKLVEIMDMLPESADGATPLVDMSGSRPLFATNP